MAKSVQDIIDMAIQAEMRMYGYYPTAEGGGFEMAPGPAGARPPVDGPGGEDPGAVMRNAADGSLVSPAEIYAKWQGRITSLFEPYDDLPSPAAFKTQADQMVRALERLTSEGIVEKGEILAEATGTITRAAEVSDTLGNFHGRTSDKFKSWLLLYQTVTTNQALAVQLLRGCLKVEEELWTRLPEDVDSLKDKAYDAFKDTGGFGVGDLLAIIKVVGAVATVAGWFPPAAAAAGVASNAVWVADLLVATSGMEEDKNDLAASHVEDVWANLQGAEQKIRDHLRTNEQDMANACDKLLDRMRDKDSLTPRQVGEGWAAGYTMPARKGLSQATTEDEVISEYAEVLIEPWELRKAARILSKQLAVQLGQAREAIDPFPSVGIWERDPRLGTGEAKGAYSAFSGPAYYLMRSMEAAATELTNAADVLLEILEMWGQVEGDVNGELGRLHREMEKRASPPSYSGPTTHMNYGSRGDIPI